MCDEVAVCGSGPDDHSTPQACRVCLDSLLLGARPSSLLDFQRLCAEDPGSQPRYFPTGVFENTDIEQWWNCRNSRFLAAIQEAPLWPAPRNLEAFCLLWLRGFRRLLVIRVERRSNHILLVRKEADVQEAFEPGELVVNEIRSVSRAQWLRLKELLQKAESPESQVASVIDSTLAKEEWTLEGIKSGEYHVDVWYRSPFGPAARRELISYLLSMAGIGVAPDEL
jgi:hypothetical protein